MPYRVELNGATVYADTAMEVRELLAPIAITSEVARAHIAAGEGRATAKAIGKTIAKMKRKDKPAREAVSRSLKSKTCRSCKATFTTPDGRQRRCRDCLGLTKDLDLPLAAGTVHKH